MTLSKNSSNNSNDNTAGFLYDPAEDLSLPPELRIYVNRNLRMNSIRAVGFDLDHTLSHYDQNKVGELAFSTTKQKLVENKGYDKEILGILYDPDFIIRGLVIDLERGNLLKMDCYDYVRRAYHAKRLLSSNERKKTYSSRRFLFSNNIHSSVDTLFHLPEVYLFMSIIDFLENKGQKPDYKQLFLDVREMIDEAHRDGSIKNKIILNPEQYVRSEPMIFKLFDRLRSSGKKLFLLTNSEPEYTDALMNYASGFSNGRIKWNDYFNIIITRANKPYFFSKRKSKKLIVKGLSSSYEYFNAYTLERTLGCKADQIMYFGDHTYGDILKAKKTMGWRTGMIVPELEQEIIAALRIRKAYNKLVRLSSERRKAEEEKVELLSWLERSSKEGNDDYAGKRIELLNKNITDLSDEIDILEATCQFAYNVHWGSIFREGKQTSRFGHQVKDFACIYMHKVSNMINYSKLHYFQANVDFMPHEFFL